MEVRYKLHDAQFDVFDDGNRFVILSAGRRFGKTFLAIVKLLTHALQKEKVRVWYIAPTYKQAKMIAWKMLLDMVPPEVISKKNEVELEVNLVNGSEIALKGADNPDSLRGPGLYFVVLDEYAFMKKFVWEEIVRPMLTEHQGKALFISTPRGKNHFYELYQKGIRKEFGYSSHAYKTEDNPRIARSEIREAQAQLSDKLFRQEFQATFEDYLGLIWPEFNYEEHTCLSYHIPDEWKDVIALDHGHNHPTAVLFGACDNDGRIIIYNEHYEAGQIISYHAEKIKEKEPKFKDLTRVIDHTCRYKTMQDHSRVYSILEAYSEHGIDFVPSIAEPLRGIQIVANLFKQNRIVIFRDKCPNLIREIENWCWKEAKEGQDRLAKEEPMREGEDACKALTYLCATRPEATEIVKPKPKGLTWKQYEEEMEMLESA